MASPGGDPLDARELLRRHRLAPKRALSQNFLLERRAIERIAETASELGREVVELGAGLGTLTEALLRTRARVTAVELDLDLVEVLQEELGAHENLTIVRGDAAKIDYAALAARRASKLVVCGNLPYHATGAILRRVVHHRPCLEGAVLMVQREVRDRLVAHPATKEYGALTVFAQAGFEIDTVLRLRPGAFHPAPDVQSAVVRMIPRLPPLAEETPAFRHVVRAGFHTRRKTLRNALRASGSAAQATRALDASGIDGARRAETLSVREFAALAKSWDRAGETDCA